MLFIVIACPVLFSRSQAMLFPLLWTLLDGNWDRTATSFPLYWFPSPPPQNRRYRHDAVSAASASTVHVERAPFQRQLSCTIGLVTVPPVTSPFEVPRRRRYDTAPSNCHQQRPVSCAEDLTVPPPSPAKAEQLRGNKCRSRGTYRNSGPAEETPPTASQTGRREPLTGGTDGGGRRAHQKHRRGGRDDQQRQRRRTRGAHK